MTKVYKETWKSSTGDREDHYHMDRNRRVYLFGVNPVLLRKNPNLVLNLIKKILKTVDKPVE